MKFNRRMADTPHPAIISLKPRVWLDAADRNNTILNGSDVEGWLKKIPGGLNFSQDVEVNQPADAGTEIDWDDPSNNQFLDSGSDYLYIDNSHSGVTFFFLAKSDQDQIASDRQKYVFDFGNYGTEGFGVGYARNSVWCYTPSSHGGTITVKRPLDSPDSDYHVAGLKIIFGSSQTLYLDNVQQAQSAITLSQLTSAEIAEDPTATNSSGPPTVGGSSKNPPITREFKGTLKNVLIYDEVLSDYQTNIMFRYQKNKELV